MKNFTKLLMSMLALVVASTAAFAQEQTPAQRKADFKTNIGNKTDGSIFIVKIDRNFWPENYGSEPVDNGMYLNFYNTLETLAGSQNAASYLYDKSVYDVIELSGVATEKKDEVSNNLAKGKLYGYNADELTRFIFLERDKNNAWRDTQNPKYFYDNPYKKNDRSSLVSDNGYREWSVQPSSFTSGTGDGTREWIEALGTENLQSRIDESHFVSATDYGYLPFTHDCSQATIRNHYMYMSAPTISNNGPDPHYTFTGWRKRTNIFGTTTYTATYTVNSGHNSNNTNCCSVSQTISFTGAVGNTTEEHTGNVTQYYKSNDSFSASCGAGVQNKSLLLFVPEKGNNNIYPSGNTVDKDYQPYMQFYMVKWNEGATVSQQATENADIWDHSVTWFTCVDDKFNDGGQVQYFTITATPDVIDEDKDIKVKTDTRYTHTLPLKWTRLEETYYVTYVVTCYIAGLDGVTCQTEIKRLPVPGKGGNISLKVSSKSTPDDANNQNKVVHTLKIEASDLMNVISDNNAAGEFLIEKKNDNGTWTTVKTVPATEANLVQTLSDNPVYYSYTDTQQGAGVGKDIYRVTFNCTQGTLGTKSTDEETAPFIYCDFGAYALVTDKITENNQEKNVYVDYIWFADLQGTELANLKQYYSRIHNSIDNAWSNGTEIKMESATSDAADCQNFVKTTAEQAQFTVIGYVDCKTSSDIMSDYGTWGVGPKNTNHVAGEDVKSWLNAESQGENLALDVKPAEVDGADTSIDPMWKDGAINFESENGPDDWTQIFPGSNFLFHVNKIYRDESQNAYAVFYELNIFDANGAKILNWKTKGMVINQTEGGDFAGHNGTNGFYVDDDELASLIPVSLTKDYTKHVMYDFSKHPGCTFEVLAHYTNPATGRIVATASSSYVDETTTTHKPVVYKGYEFENAMAESLKHTLNTNGFGFTLLDLDSAIDKVKAGTDADLFKAVKSYKITAVQKTAGQTAARSQKKAAGEGEVALKVFTPIYNGSNIDDIETETVLGGMKNVIYPHDEEGKLDDMYVYANSDAAGNVKIQPRSGVLVSDDKNYMLLGFDGVDNQSKFNRDGGYGDDKNIAIDIIIQPVYTVADLNRPVIMNIDETAGEYKTYRGTITYADDSQTTTNNGLALDNEHADEDANGAPLSYITNVVDERYKQNEQITPLNFNGNELITGAEAIGEDGFAVYVEGRTIVVDGEASQMAVYTVDGSLVYAGAKQNVEVETGIYLVNVDSKTRKVAVK